MWPQCYETNIRFNIEPQFVAVLFFYSLTCNHSWFHSVFSRKTLNKYVLTCGKLEAECYHVSCKQPWLDQQVVK